MILVLLVGRNPHYASHVGTSEFCGTQSILPGCGDPQAEQLDPHKAQSCS